MLILVFVLLSLVQCYERGDHISTSIQTVHGDWKTSWIDLRMDLMPSFMHDSSTIVHVSLPIPNSEIVEGEDQRFRLNLHEDVKFSLTFADRKIILAQVWLVFIKLNLSTIDADHSIQCERDAFFENVRDNICSRCLQRAQIGL